MFRTPTFNLTINLWREWDVTLGPPHEPPGLKLQGALRNSWRSLIVSADFTNVFHNSALALGGKADIRGPHAGHRADLVEVPAGTGRFYQVIQVDDVAKGFVNEYRIASIQSLESVPGFWPYPTP